MDRKAGMVANTTRLFRTRRSCSRCTLQTRRAIGLSSMESNMRPLTGRTTWFALRILETAKRNLRTLEQNPGGTPSRVVNSRAGKRHSIRLLKLLRGWHRRNKYRTTEIKEDVQGAQGRVLFASLLVYEIWAN